MSLQAKQKLNFRFEWMQTLVAILLFATLGVRATPVHAEGEDEIKAAFLLNFARYVEWPESAFEGAESAVKICMLEAADFKDVVSTITEGKSVGTRSVEVVDILNGGESSSCHILFLGENVDSHNDVIDVLQSRSVFSVADDEKFARQGGIANFYRAGNRIRFEINQAAAETAGLKISSRLLRLARLVE